MKLFRLVRLTLPALVLALGVPALLVAQNGQPQDHRDYDRGGWDAPPQEFRDMQRQGFRDGIQAGRRDFESHRPPHVDAVMEFRNPSVPEGARDEYREGFRRGYEVAFSHLREGMGAGPMNQNGPPPHEGYGQDHPDHDHDGWDAPPQEFRDIQRQGFRDGVQAGRSDFENHRSPHVESTGGFRRPPVRPDDRDAYREGFRRGYDMAFSHFREDRDHH
jgi:hypothetical protein